VGVTIAPRPVAFAIGALTLFGVGGLALGGMLAASAWRVARVTGGSPELYLAGGGMLVLVSLWVTFRALQRWTSIRAIDTAGDTWRLRDFLGRTHAIGPDLPISLELRGRRVVWTFGAAPRLQDIVDGFVASGAGTGRRRWRLASSGPVTYDALLREVGIDDKAPRRGEQTFVVRR
jgi:hypothetical protein